MPKLLDPFTLFGCSSNKTTISLIAIGNLNVTGKITESNECMDIGQFGHAYVEAMGWWQQKRNHF